MNVDETLVWPFYSFCAVWTIASIWHEKILAYLSTDILIYLLRDANSFSRAHLEENCKLQFEEQMMSNCVHNPSNIFCNTISFLIIRLYTGFIKFLALKMHHLFEDSIYSREAFIANLVTTTEFIVSFKHQFNQYNQPQKTKNKIIIK